MTIDQDTAIAIGRLDAHDQAALLTRGELSPAELVDSALQRIALLDPAINAVTHVAPDIARARADAPSGDSALRGVPWLLKASLEYPGWPLTSCSRSRADARGSRAWPFAQACDAAGLVPVGMTGMPEFGLLTTGEPVLTGAVRNPHAPDRSAGGSSSGAAAAVAAGLAPFAHASDAAGSIRIPAANCGVVGFKPGRGANVRARAPHLIDDLLCSDMMIARSMRDVAWAFDLVTAHRRPAAPARPLRGLRVGLALEGIDGELATDAVIATIAATAQRLEEAGAIVEPVTLPGDLPAIARAFETIWIHEGGEIADLVGAANPHAPLDTLLEAWTLGLAARRADVSLEATADAFRQVALSERAAAAFFERHDLLLSPVAPEPPIALGRHDPMQSFDTLWEDFWRFVTFTPLANIAGLPSIALPVKHDRWEDAGPIGTMLTAAAGNEALLLAVGGALEDMEPSGFAPALPRH